MKKIPFTLRFLENHAGFGLKPQCPYGNPRPVPYPILFQGRVGAAYITDIWNGFQSRKHGTGLAAADAVAVYPGKYPELPCVLK